MFSLQISSQYFKIWYSILIFILLLIFDYLLVHLIGLGYNESLKWLLLIINCFVLLFLVIFNSFFILCLILFTLPFSKGIFNFEISVITFNPYTMGIIVLSFYSLYCIFVKGFRYNFDVIDLIIALICISFFISTILADNVIDAGFLAFHDIFIPVLSYFVIKTLINNDFEHKQAILFFIVSLSIYGLFALVEFLKTYQRVFVFSVPPIGVATFLSVSILYLFYNKWYKNFFGLIGLIINLGGFIVTFCRVYTLTLIFSPIFYKLFKNGKAFIVIVFFFLFSLLATMFVTYSPNIFNVNEKICMKIRSEEKTIKRLLDINFYKCSLYGRAIYYKLGFNNFLNNPFFGVGFYRGKTKGLPVITQHNFHIEWLEFGGIFGYLFYIFLFILFFKKYGPFAYDNFIVINLLIIFIILCNSLTNGFMHGKMPYVAFIMIGFTAARYKIINKNLK